MTQFRQEKLAWLREKMQQISQCWTPKELARDILESPWNDERRKDWLRRVGLAENCDVAVM